MQSIEQQVNETKKKLPEQQGLDPKYLAHSKLLCYCALQYPKYKIAAHHQLIADHLEAVERGEINRLIIATPPRSGKTMLVSQFFPAWYLGRHPERQIIAATYSGEKAGDVGREVRNQLIDPLHHHIFPNCQISRDSASVKKFSTTKYGNYFSVGLGGAITGRGANCVDGDTLISTDIGQVKIKELVDFKDKPMVLSLGKKGLSFKPIIAYRNKKVDTIYHIKTSSGCEIKTTGEHRFYVPGSGYVETKDLCQGQLLIKIKEEQNLCNLWEGKDWPWGYVPGMLFQGQKTNCESSMCMVQENIRKEHQRSQEIRKKKAQCFLLLAEMFQSTSCYKKSQEMRDLWQTYRKKNQKILFRFLQDYWKKIKAKETQSKNLRILWKDIRDIIETKKILFKRLSECRTFNTNERQRKFALQKWYQLCKRIRFDSSKDYTTRFKPLCCLWARGNETGHRLEQPNCFKNEFSCTSYRWESSKQYSGELDSIMFDLSCNSSQITYDTISMVQKIRKDSIDVYDLQIADNQNFFANSTLVHNCFLIDDPIKGRENAESETRRRQMKQWYEGVAYTRLMPEPNAIVIIATRWHSDDLSGWLLREHTHEDWVYLRLPALADSNDDLLERGIGEALWPEWFDEDYLLNVKDTVGTREWSAQYQQVPILAEGGIINIDWFKRYKIVDGQIAMEDKDGNLQFEHIKRTVQSWDTAYKAKELNDPSVCTTWKVTKKGYFLWDVFAKRMEYPELRKQVGRQHTIHNPNAILVEDKSSGQSLIQEFRMTDMPIIGIMPVADKVTRMSTESDTIEAGKVYLPESAPWLIDYETELGTFPYGQFDDQVDSTSQFLQWIKRKGLYKKRNIQFWK